MSEVPSELRSLDLLLKYLEIGDKEWAFLQNHAAYRYSAAYIPKRKGGTRRLLVPDTRLKFIQRKLLSLLEQIYVAREPVNGFVRSRTAVTNATAHQARPYILNIDLKNFFGTITRRRVAGLMRALGVDADVAEAICVLCVTRNELPQGAPTSPILSNMVCFRLDVDLMRFAKKYQLKYTRYADDITFSSYRRPEGLFKAPFPGAGKLLPEMLADELLGTIAANGFAINEEKIWFAPLGTRKEVTGLIVNEFTNVDRSFIRNLRAALCSVERLGPKKAEEEHKTKNKAAGTLAQDIRGRLEWIAQVRGRSYSAYRTLAKKYAHLFGDQKIKIEPNYPDLAERAVWVVEYWIDKDLSFQGTAFFVSGIGLLTAAHVLEEMPVGVAAELFRPSLPGRKFTAVPTMRPPYDPVALKDRDIMVLDHNVPKELFSELPIASLPVSPRDAITALGFPAFAPGDGLGFRAGHVISTGMRSGFKQIEISAMLPGGISGGPVVNERYQVVGVAVRGRKDEPKQLALNLSEVTKLTKIVW